MSQRTAHAFIHYGLLVVLMAAALIILTPAESEAMGPGVPGGGGGEVETTGNNLSYPVVLVDGATLTLREPPVGFDYSLAGTYWYGWIDPIALTQMACDPGVQPCPPPAVDLNTVSRIYLQKDPLSVWQAAHIDAAAVDAAYLDWSDNLESTVWSASSVIRVETVPFAAQTGALGFQMWWASGKGVDEVWGARATNTDPPVPTDYPWSPGYATVVSGNAFLTLQKLEAGEGNLSYPPDTTGYVWNATAHQWDNVAGQTVRVEPYTAEINVGGKAIYGFNWNVKRQVMTAGETKGGWWRLTFSTTNNKISFLASTVLTPPLTAPVSPLAFEAKVDLTNNLTYIDVWLKAAKPGGQKGI